jgi:hypothetical protein
VRLVFVAYGVLSIVVVAVGFGPNVYGSFTGGTPIPAPVYLHGAIMLAWVGFYTVQAALVARGRVALHRRLGVAGGALAAVCWLSMGAATVGALARFDPNQFGFLVKPLLIQLGQMVLFTLFVAWAVLARRLAAWHKRLMTLATLVLLQSALDRMHWLPNEGLPMFWHSGLRLYVLMIPLWVLDVVTLRRIHPATWMGTGLVVAMHAVVSAYWDDEGWNQLARAFWLSLR